MEASRKYNANSFPLENNHRNRELVKVLRKKFGAEGYGIYIMLLELLTSKDYFKLSFTELDLEIIASDLDIEVDKLTGIIDYAKKTGLLSGENNMVFSPYLNDFLPGILKTREKNR